MCYVLARLAQHAQQHILEHIRTILIPQTLSIEGHSDLNAACSGGFLFSLSLWCDTGKLRTRVRTARCACDVRTALRRTILDLIM
jgi:hypothetical protein